MKRLLYFSEFAHNSSKLDLVDAPINPDWILEGNPTARNYVLFEGHTFRTTIWDCTAGSFNWHYTADETVNIIGGECSITDSRGRSHKLTAGDTAMFAEGDSLRWDIPVYVRKFAVWGLPGRQIARYLASKMISKSAVTRERTARTGEPRRGDHHAHNL